MIKLNKVSLKQQVIILLMLIIEYASKAMNSTYNTNIISLVVKRNSAGEW